jgi:3-oxoacyl-[acyl-carrier protein] reductase
MSAETLNTLKADLTGQIAIVTGAAQGLGQQIAITLAANGAKVACLDMKKEALEDTIKAITDAGGSAESYECNVTDRQRVDEVVEEIADKWEKIDILVNNAGITRDGLLVRMKAEDWDAVVDTNLKGAFLCTKLAAKVMMKQRFGRIINISSVVAVTGNPGQANYVASKAGLIGFTKAVALELASRGITANAVAPGFIETDMTASLGEKARDAMVAQIPLGRPGTAEEVAAVVEFLASERAAYLTGQVLHVSGGMVV